MVSFQSIASAISQNANAVIRVGVYKIRPQPLVESFRIPTMRIEPAVIPAALAAVQTKRPRSPSPQSIRSVHSDKSTESTEALPLPNRIVGVVREVVHEVKATEVQPAKKVKDVKDAREVQLKEVQPREIRPHGRVMDPICIGLEKADAMYAIATPNVQQSLECEEARRLESRISELYKGESGRSRGWTKTKLEAFLVPRAAQGSRVRDTFDWSKIWTDKDASAILDFVCLAKGIRLAVWKDAEVGLWPAADATNASRTIPIYHIHASGRMIEKTDKDLKACRILAPYSVEHGLEKLTLDELDGLAEKMGIPIPSGKKMDKVRFLASARMALRLSV
jgi:hypothetical protein